MIIAILLMVGCSRTKTIDNKTYQTYGLFNESDIKDSNIIYKPCIGNVVWTVITIETVILPVYFIGYDLYEPIAKKPNVK